MTAFMTFWANLNAEMKRRGESEVLLEDARHLHKLFGGVANSAAEHEATLRRKAVAPIRSCVVGTDAYHEMDECRAARAANDDPA